jgi:SAM-dependent methyltransferase
LFRIKPEKILDIGSYRLFIIGLLGHYQVTTLDVRDRESESPNESIYTHDARSLEFPDSTFDCVVSLCALEHFGLGRYGDPFDPEGDKKAIREMIRVLKPHGHLLLTTSITNAPSAIAFNAHRIYDLDMLHSYCAGLTCEEEKFFSITQGKFVDLAAVTHEAEKIDIYCGAWLKP